MLSMIRVHPITAVVVLVLSVGFSSQTYGFSVESVRAQIQGENQVVVHVDTEVRLTASVIEALNSSIPITIKTEIRLYRKRKNMWDKRILNYVVADEIRYSSLYRSYYLNSSDAALSGFYYSLERALQVIGRNRKHQLALDDGAVESQQAYRGWCKLSLDRSALPAVLRVPVFFQRDWQLATSKARFEVQ